MSSKDGEVGPTGASAVGVISDIHGNLPALNAVVAELERRGVERLVCVGDIIGVLGSPQEVSAYIREHSEATIIGNHDLRVAPQRDWMPVRDHEVVEYEHTLEELDEETYEWLVNLPGLIETNDGLVLAHSSPNSESPSGTERGDAGIHPGRFTSVATDLGDVVLLLGHTHYQHAVDLAKFAGQSGLVLNPGSVGFPFTTDVETQEDGSQRFIGTASFAIVDTDTHEYHLDSVTYDSTSVVEHLREYNIHESATRR